jgi:hypothetical protein
MKECDKGICHISSKLHMIDICCNIGRHTFTKNFAPLHYTSLHFTTPHSTFCNNTISVFNKSEGLIILALELLDDVCVTQLQSTTDKVSM